MEAAYERAVQRIERVGSGQDTMDVLTEIQAAIQEATPFDGCFMGAADPATTLSTSSALIGALPEWTCAPFWDGEFLTDDYSKFVDLHRAGGKSVTMDRATQGRRTRSHRHNTINSAIGFGPELRATFSEGDACWGLVNLLREDGRPDFDDDELRFIDKIAPIAAAKIRTSMIRRLTAPSEGLDDIGLVLFDEHGAVLSMNARAADLLARFGQRDTVDVGGARIPSEAYIVTARARARALGRFGPDPVARVVVEGMPLTLRADCTRRPDGGLDVTALIVEPTRAGDVLSMAVAARGLTPREDEVLRLLLGGSSAAEVADKLFISVHTARDHTKSIYEKMGVNSRAELTSVVFGVHHLPSLDIRHSDSVSF